jgi:hypothetical protein
MTVSQVNVKPSLHPIGDPDHLLQTRAIGVLKGVIAPDGAITLTGGFHGKSLTLGREVCGLVRTLLKKRVNEALFVVYPRTKDGFVTSLEVIGVWKPSVLNPNSEEKDYLPEGENYFSIRGEVHHKVWYDENYGRSVAVKVFGQHFVTVDFGDAPYLSKGDFVTMDAILTEDGRFYTERVEKISIPDAALTRPRRHHGHQMVRRRSSAA